MKILSIETSCDETAIALVEAKGGLKNPRFKILKNLVSSQIKIHRPFGGVVPNLAKREHLKNLPILYKKLTANNLKLKADLIAVTVGPGLEPALWTGIEFAKQINLKLKTKNSKPKIIGVNHLEAHLYSFLLGQMSNVKCQKPFPAIGLIVSGGHTILLLMKDLAHYKKLGETRDDAVGEAFDKVARLLKLQYPGGPEIEKLAKTCPTLSFRRGGNSKSINFPRPMIDQKNYDFSFSGLKTSVLYYLRDNKKFKKENVAASFQEAAFDVLIKKTLRAAEEFGAKSILISGGVAANKTLQKRFQKAVNELTSQQSIKLIITQFPTDNAAMIASAGYMSFLKKKNHKLVANGNLNIK